MGAVIGHEGIQRELRSLALSEDPPHALLLVGPEGTGRRALALEYARWLNCERAKPPVTAGAAMFDMGPAAAETMDAPCGTCRHCHLIEAGTHPDVIVLGPGDTLCRPRSGESSHERHPQSREIRICQVRGLIDLAARYPFEAPYRMVILDPADRLGREAAHTILKTLEEPPGHSVFALVTSAPEALLETIRSRCRRIDVPIVARATIEAGLIARGVTPELAAQAAAAARGRPGAAVRFAAEPSLMGDRARLLERCAEMAAAGLAKRFGYAENLAERYRKDRTAAAGEIEAWEAFWEADLRANARGGDGSEAELRGSVGALRAIAQLRDDLQANVLARAAIELMLLRFPRRTLSVAAQDEPPSHA